MALYLCSLYSTSPDDPKIVECGILNEGYYGAHRCGGCCTWLILDKKPSDSVDTVFCIPYSGQEHMYLFSFFRGDARDTPLWKRLQMYAGRKNTTIVLANDGPEYVLLTDEKVDNFNHEEDGLIDANGEIMDDPDGTVEYANLMS